MEKHESENEMKGGSTSSGKTELYVQIGIIAILALVIVFNTGKVYSSIGPTGLATGVGTVSASEIIPEGIPAVYGASMGISYDDVSPNNPRLADATIAKLSEYEDLQLNAEQLERYIMIAGSISCEYCCGAESIIFSNGERACGCAHSYAMRGLAKYLLINNPEMSDADILRELGKWKVLFFPGIHEQKAQVLEANGIDSTDYINLASNLYRGIEKGQSSSGGAMVGGC
ncbi:hypothetical protein COU60_02570 [Candidatus Pacearchaeota archaeon CG10_big_fil_rev_8_21_14_0_10_34_76]|nr:MAG: hypothetical protein COU60_02570 [Candidatus Pacearchaeota archaeon CG10_big_fil_rev_8_21_14_0_10_34_76]